uniref:Uncharacterized protein n=1 Tax=Romanomermis culicivorax TaxID=13658 RepID=A0A915IFR0_ROMCU
MDRWPKICHRPMADASVVTCTKCNLKLLHCYLLMRLSTKPSCCPHRTTFHFRLCCVVYLP